MQRKDTETGGPSLNPNKFNYKTYACQSHPYITISSKQNIITTDREPLNTKNAIKTIIKIELLDCYLFKQVIKQ